jgi:ABC-type antimicrobial peptide transport system permease subunit
MRAMVLRTRERPEALVATTRRALSGVATGIRYLDVHPLQQHIDPLVRPWKLGATMFGIFGALALVIAAVGLYSVMAYEVAQRAHEIGVRVALGAQRGSVARLVLGRGMRVAVSGLALGAVVAWLSERWVAPLLFRVDARDPLIYGIVAVTLLGAAVLATLLPALRATRVDPLQALRSD